MARSQGTNQELSEVLNDLWHLDVNRLKPGTDYIISPQGRAGYVAQGSNYARDRARAPLFTYVNEDKLRSIKTYSHFINLLDNYEMSTGVSEKVTSEEFEENHKFLDAILETEVMKHAHQYLIQKRQSPTDLTHFKRQLYDIWFRLYHRDRSGGEDSCGFEHVFVGETKYGQEMMGLHNWVQFYLQEKRDHIDYKGYKARDKKNTPDEDDHVLNLQFSWKGLVKPIGGSFIGVSPEFEVALFTVIFLASTEKRMSVLVKVDEYTLELVVYRHGRSIGTSYPKLLSSNNQDL
ncbi:uridylate-specific endoribonuclease C-like [Nerophis ophidion]|uniref:uridylate-specific endoribonuclease C-like n=1 Tax=Nerophis ophidion TaxID=159077 RepID=UPI002ADF03D8|nr:uridylate-specific endoribonuclease C-like [Nerophis ophidion]XP_061775618.1 uridylate-specific endoribonuclease C-like [Nerophis ophidion]